MAADALGRPFVVSKQVPADRLAVLRAAFDRTIKDAQFLAETQKLDLPVEGPISGPQPTDCCIDLRCAAGGDCPCPSHRREIRVRYFQIEWMSVPTE